MYPNTKYNDPANRDLLPHAQMPTNQPFIGSNDSIIAVVGAGCEQHSDRIALDPFTSTVPPRVGPLMRSMRRGHVAAMPLPEPEEKQSARGL